MTNNEAKSVIECLLTDIMGDFAYKEMTKGVKHTFDALKKAKEALEKADTYKKVVFTKDGEEFRVLMDTKRCLVYPISYTLEVCDALGWVLKGEEVGV